MTRSERLFRSLLILTITCASLWGVWNILVSKPAIANNMPPGKTLTINKDDVAAVADAVNSSAQEEEPEEDSLYAGGTTAGRSCSSAWTRAAATPTA